MCFASAHRLGLADTDPTRDIDLPPRVTGETRPLDEAEAVELRAAAEFTHHVPHDQDGGEAAVALELACGILDAADGCMGVLYDGAFRGMHRDVIARRGRLLINKNRRMIAFGAEAQSLVVLGFLLAQNATSAARYQEDPTYADADAEATDTGGTTARPR
ncbi:hypothetical protein [Streptomyces sp. NPDC059071]|uniref:hypothetical protein n=1 Tax=unclassified Streptomyces TaxID=2593676 RepID=UPI0036673966